MMMQDQLRRIKYKEIKRLLKGKHLQKAGTDNYPTGEASAATEVEDFMMAELTLEELKTAFR